MSSARRFPTAFVPFLLLVSVSAFVAIVWTAQAADTPPATQQQTVNPAQPQAVSDRNAASKPGRPQAVTEQEDVRAFDESELRDFYTIESAVEIVEQASDPRSLRDEPAIPVSLITAKLRGGVVLQQGESLAVGDVVLRGIIQNQSDRAIALKYADTGEFFDLLPGETVIVAAETGCSISCDSGRYGCCNIVQGTAKCKCPENANVQECAAGGPGTNGCSIWAAS